MEPEATKKPVRKSKPKPPLTIEQAKEKILGDLQKVGAKGKALLFTKPQLKNPQHAATYEAALAELIDSRPPEVFVELGGKKPKYFLWVYRPEELSPASVGEKLMPFIAAEHPRVHSESSLKKPATRKKLGLSKDELALLGNALESLQAAGRLLPLEYPGGTNLVRLYVAAERIGPAIESDAAPAKKRSFSPAELQEAYESLVERTGFRAVSITKLASEAGAALEPLKDWLRQAHRDGRVVLSLGDWSIAGEDERRGLIEMHGQRYLQVRWL